MYNITVPMCVQSVELSVPLDAFLLRQIVGAQTSLYNQAYRESLRVVEIQWWYSMQYWQ